MKRVFSSLWFGRKNDSGKGEEEEEIIIVEEEKEAKYQKQLREDEEYARKLFEEEERKERERIAQEKADEELAKKISESYSPPHLPPPPPAPSSDEFPTGAEIVEWNPSASRRNEQIENDELLAISLSLSDLDSREIGPYNEAGYDDDDVQYLGTKRPKVEEYTEKENEAGDKRTSMLIASVKDELRMPEVDIHSLLCEFNRLIFYGKLDSVSISWSSQMKLCAGVCKYSRGGFCEVRLSEPLLKFRPRSDFLNTLLHEMIHAYLFVTHNNKDHDGHGPEFLGWADRINKKFGTNITVYHNFHDEVDYYRTHWWQCDGPCKFKPPYFGLVKRSMNRPPGPTDSWWGKHQKTCGGTFVKIRSPEPKKKNANPSKKKGKEEKGKITTIEDSFNWLTK